MLPQVQNLEFIRLAKDFITENPNSSRGKFIKFIFQNYPKIVKRKIKYRKDAEKGYDFVKIMIRDNVDESEWISGHSYVYEKNIVDSNKRSFDDSMSDSDEPIHKKPKLEDVSYDVDGFIHSSDELMEDIENLLPFPESLVTYIEDISHYIGTDSLKKCKPLERKRILISGPSECGKSTFIQWIAQKYNYKYISVTKDYMNNFSSAKFRRDIEHVQMQHDKCLVHIDFNSYPQRIADNFITKRKMGRGDCSLIVYETSDPEPLERWSDFHLKFPNFGVLDRQRSLKHFLRGYKLGKDLTYEKMSKSTPCYQIGELESICELLKVPNKRIKEENFLSVLKERKIKNQFVANEVIRFSDIGGHDEVKTELLDIKRKLLDENSNFEKDGIILYGPPGCGKTMLAKALSNETEFTFISMSITDIVSKYQGVSEKKIREFFQNARSCQPSILFIDEMDALCSQRHDDNDRNGKNSIVNTFLTEMDGVASSKNDRVLVIGATNFIGKIDNAIKRSKRMGRHIEVNIPKNADQRFDVLMAASKNGKDPVFGSNSRDHDIFTVEDIFREISQDKYTEGWNHSDLAALISQSYSIMESSNSSGGSDPVVTMKHVKAAHLKKNMERKMNNRAVSSEFDENTTKIFLGDFEERWMSDFVFDEEILDQLHDKINQKQFSSLLIRIGGRPNSGKSTLIRYLAQKYEYNLVTMENSYFQNFNLDRFYRDFSQFVKKNGPTLLHIVNDVTPISVRTEICRRIRNEVWVKKVLLVLEKSDVTRGYINILPFTESHRINLLQTCLSGLSFVLQIDKDQFLNCTTHWTHLHYSELKADISLLRTMDLIDVIYGINDVFP